MLVGRPLLRRCCCCYPTTTTSLPLATATTIVRRDFNFPGKRSFRTSHRRAFPTDDSRDVPGPDADPAHGAPGPRRKSWIGLPHGSFDYLGLSTSRGASKDAHADAPADADVDAGTDAPQPDKPPVKNWNRITDEEVLHLIDVRTRERASQNVVPTRTVEPPRHTMENASRFLLRELLAKDLVRKYTYKKGAAQETESELSLFERSLDISLVHVQNHPKPGFHPLPFYTHRHSKQLDKALSVVLTERQPGIVNKVCYNLLVSEAAPTIRTFNIMLRRFTKLRMTNLAHIILTTLFAVRLEPNAHTYAAILQYLTVVGDYDAFGKAVTIIRNSFIDYKNPVLGAAELNGWSKFGDFMSMRRRLRLLQAEGLRDDTFILTIELRYYARRHMWEGGLPALGLLFRKPIETIDHRALYWAWKLCHSCQQTEYIERLKLLAQEKRWPVEMLWTRPQKTKGLEFGYVGRSSGQELTVDVNEEGRKWEKLWKNDEEEKEPPPIRMSAKVPRAWGEYSAMLYDRIQGDQVVMQDRTEAIVGGPAAVEEHIAGVEAAVEEAASSVEHAVDTTNSVSESALPARKGYTAHSESSIWKSLVYNRTQELLGPGFNTSQRRRT
ncbi:hypothetical protein Dda_2371 [Drechslerella dactyloides]|uniref:Uncharacterized protein n=1 Tax=Drechslerella dactyloides TaxID=74499 RepID=A0AAD6NMA6_DREDA|nr:hypothetical protein Dda_2371 [Drechslerella dactyloides]